MGGYRGSFSFFLWFDIDVIGEDLSESELEPFDAINGGFDAGGSAPEVLSVEHLEHLALGDVDGSDLTQWGVSALQVCSIPIWGDS